ncbi:lipopolysaccharide biosynthesis protein [Planktomarina temperata]|nr:lipopolysaccharide biosynthesis protein [Planktomarina temperata]
MNKKKQNQKRSLLSGIRWTLFQRGSYFLVSTALTIIMARLLTPDDFGLVAMAAVFTGISASILDMGLKDALVREKNPSDEFICTMFWLTILFSLFIWIILIISASAIANLYNEKIVKIIIYCLSVNMLFSGVRTIYLAVLEKALDFKNIAIFELLSRVVSGSVGIFMGVFGFGVWSLVTMTILNECLVTLILIIKVKWKPSIRFNIKHAKAVYRFGLYLTLTQFLDHTQRRLEVFIVSFFIGTQSSGIYSQTNILLRQPVKLINGSINAVFFSYFSSTPEKRQTINLYFLKLIQATAILYLPICIIMILYSEVLVLVILGEKWFEMASILPFIGITATILSLHRSNCMLLKTLGRTDALFKVYCVYLGLTLVGCILGVRYGIQGVAFVMIICSSLLFVISTSVVLHLSKIKISIYLAQIASPFVYAVASLLAGYLVEAMTVTNLEDSPKLSATFGLLVSLACYIGALLLRPLPVCNDFVKLFNVKYIKKANNI